ncbi:MAG: hypothetical protein QXG48_02445 [Thermofilaceae archaeon]
MRLSLSPAFLIYRAPLSVRGLVAHLAMIGILLHPVAELKVWVELVEPWGSTLGLRNLCSAPQAL